MPPDEQYGSLRTTRPDDGVPEIVLIRQPCQPPSTADGRTRCGMADGSVATRRAKRADAPTRPGMGALRDRCAPGCDPRAPF